MQKPKYIILLGIFFLLTGFSYLLFNRFLPSAATPPPLDQVDKSLPKEPATGFITFSGPKTQACPLNGSLHTQKEEELWSQRRPLLAVIENHLDSRPQSGLSNADIVYEAVAEGGITRFLAVFYCAALRGASRKYDIGPVRSARTYFLDLASEYADYPLFAHVGGANCSAPKDPSTGQLSGACTTNKKAQAIEQINQYGWTSKDHHSDLNQFSLSYKVCRREPERTGESRATEHTMYCSTTQLWQTAADRGLTSLTASSQKPWDKNFIPWQADQKDQPVASPSAAKISFDFWPGYQDYSVSWHYDQSSNSYTRFQNNQTHIDFNSQQPLTAKNVIIQFVKESRNVDEHLHNLYQVIGQGKGLLFQNGQKINIVWAKKSRSSRTIFKTKTGQPVNFVPGPIWIELLPSTNTVNYEN